MAAPGWYGDPGGSDQLRWWDGATWTGHLRPYEPAQTAQQTHEHQSHAQTVAEAWAEFPAEPTTAWGEYHDQPEPAGQLQSAGPSWEEDSRWQRQTDQGQHWQDATGWDQGSSSYEPASPAYAGGTGAGLDRNVFVINFAIAVASFVALVGSFLPLMSGPGGSMAMVDAVVWVPIFCILALIGGVLGILHQRGILDVSHIPRVELMPAIGGGLAFVGWLTQLGKVNELINGLGSANASRGIGFYLIPFGALVAFGAGVALVVAGRRK